MFVDTSMFYAAADRGDRSNARAKQVRSADERLVTSEHVLVETWFLISHLLGRSSAERFWEAIRAGAASVEPVTAADLEVAFAIGEVFPDQDFSIVDRTSFASCSDSAFSEPPASTSTSPSSGSAGVGVALLRLSTEEPRASVDSEALIVRIGEVLVRDRLVEEGRRADKNSLSIQVEWPSGEVD